MAKKFMYVCLGILALVIASTCGRNSDGFTEPTVDDNPLIGTWYLLTSDGNKVTYVRSYVFYPNGTYTVFSFNTGATGPAGGSEGTYTVDGETLNFTSWPYNNIHTFSIVGNMLTWQEGEHTETFIRH
jgi:hypothetical protein